MSSFNEAWLYTLAAIEREGWDVKPRGMMTKELPQYSVAVDMLAPVLTFKERKLHYPFMAAEALWILTGDNRVETIAPYNKHISQFSDDGKTFAGAYGPRILDQLDYVVETLKNDPDTRQATLTIWSPRPEPSKDIPCTVAIDFKIRHGRLNVHVFMRSSDVWLGLPYDVFNFSMIGAMVCGMLNRDVDTGSQLILGGLFLTAASSHLYERNFGDAKRCLDSLEKLDPSTQMDNQRAVPVDLYAGLGDPVGRLTTTLNLIKDSGKGAKIRWWDHYDA